MRKYIIITLLLLPLIGLGQKIESGYRITYVDNEGYKVGKQIFEQGNLSFTYQIRISYKSLRLVSNTSIYMDSKGVKFAPNNSRFDIRLEYKLNDFKLSVGHRCCHPIKVDRDRERLGLFGGYNVMIGISYNFE